MMKKKLLKNNLYAIKGGIKIKFNPGNMTKNRLIGISALAGIIFLSFSCRSITQQTRDLFSMKNTLIKLSVSLAPGSKGNLDLSPPRVFVTRVRETQKPPRLLLKVSGARAGTKIYWSYRYQSGNQNPENKIHTAPFSAWGNHSLNLWDCSTTANSNGESMVVFTTTTYAGDRIQFGIGFRSYSACFENEDRQSVQFRNASLKSKPIQVWKRIFFERPKILKNVKFPRKTWDIVIENLKNLQIDVSGDFNPIELDPADPAIHYYFYTREGDESRGKGDDPRYGPAGFGPPEVMLSRMTIIFTDKNPHTLNTFIFGCVSPKYDLICNALPDSPGLKPVIYNHRYQPGEIDLNEWFALGTGSAMAGKSPAIFIWSDFWFLASQAIRVTHEQALARVILHELGHHLLMFKTGGDEGILDETGHPSADSITGRSIMTGPSIIRLDRKGKPFVSNNARRMERKFIEHPVWNPKIEMLIRRDYVPREE